MAHLSRGHLPCPTLRPSPSTSMSAFAFPAAATNASKDMPSSVAGTSSAESTSASSQLQGMVSHVSNSALSLLNFLFLIFMIQNSLGACDRNHWT